MERNYKITIPKPCQENWDKMTPKDNGRFCMSCSKTVVDFTTMLPNEIQHFFIQNQNGSICGRFKKSQLDSITIQIPDRVLYSQTHYHKIFLLALFIAMGTTLFSCADKDGNKKKIDKIEVVENNKSQENNSEKIPSENSESIEVSLSQKNTRVKFVKPISTDCEETTYGNDNKSSSKTILQDSIAEADIYITGAAIETTPYYPGGINNFYQFLVNELKLPEDIESPKSRIIVSFIIEKDGSLSSFEFPKKTDPKIEAEITCVLKLSPKWQSGEQNGKKTRTKYSLPISFQ